MTMEQAHIKVLKQLFLVAYLAIWNALFISCRILSNFEIPKSILLAVYAATVCLSKINFKNKPKANKSNFMHF